MSQKDSYRFGPLPVPTSAGNLWSPGSSGNGTNVGTLYLYFVFTHLRVVNTTNAPINVSLFIGATGGSAAGTEYGWSSTPVPAYSALDLYPPRELRINYEDYLTAVASAAGLTITAEGAIGAVQKTPTT